MFFSEPDDDLHTCEHCGTRYRSGFGIDHLCQEGYEASRKRNEEWERKFTGSGKKTVIQIAIEIECLDTHMGIETAISGVCHEIEFGINPESGKFAKAGGDSVLGYTYKFAGKKTPR
jgi:hypothetical protein